MKARCDAKDKLRLWLRLLRTTRGIEGALRESLRVNFDTTMPRFDVMAALARTPDGLTMTALSRRLLVSNGNVTGIIERLVADKLVVRSGDAGDRRATRVRLTPKGQRDFAAMAAEHEDWVAQLFHRLVASDIEKLFGLLAKAGPAHSTETDA